MDLSGQNRPKWSPGGTVSRMLKSGSEEGHFDQNGRLDHFGPFWSSTLSDSTVASSYMRTAKRKTLAMSALEWLRGLLAAAVVAVILRCKLCAGLERFPTLDARHDPCPCLRSIFSNKTHTLERGTCLHNA